MSDQTNDKILDRIVKLLNLAANNPNAEEAASAAAKAQEMMTQHNLDMGAIERKSGQTDNKREKEAVRGGFYKWNRDLYKAVAELNFCMHWLSEEWIQSPVLPPKEKKDKVKWNAAGCPADFKVLRKVHKLLGRKVNVAVTKVMATYLEQAVERILRDEMEAYNYDNKMLFSKWAMSFREGAVDNIIGRINEERERAEKERQKKAKEEAMRTAHPSAAPSTTGTAIVLADYQESEAAANYDARFGLGRWAARQIRINQYNMEWDMDDEARECLAIFHPEIYAKLIEEERKQAEKDARRSYRGPHENEKDWSAFRAGQKKAEDISLNQQIDHEKKKQLR